MKATALTSSLVLGIMGLATAGCDVELGESTLGELGRVEFSYTSSCLFGCSLDRALLPDTSGFISVSDSGDLPGTLASCTAPEIATARVEQSCRCERGGDDWAEGTSIGPEEICPEGFEKGCDNVIELSTHAEGDTTLELRHPADGSLIDRVAVHVRQPRSAWLEQDGAVLSTASPLRLTVGQSDGVVVRMEDEQGSALLVTGNVTWTISDGEVAGFPQWIGAPVDALVTDDIVSIQGVGVGETVVSVRTGDFELSTPLVVDR